MDSYEIRWKGAAQRDVRNIDPQQVPEIINAVERLIDNSFPPQHRKLRGSERDHRIRVGDYRVIYEVDNGERVVTVLHIGHRRDVYR